MGAWNWFCVKDIPSSHPYPCTANHQIMRDERQRVPARGTATTTAKADIRMSIAQLFTMGLDCIENDNLVKCVAWRGVTHA